jgi:hypothetical protein
MFQRKVNDIVIEFGNPLYQPILDQFVNGDDVPFTELSKVWKDATQGTPRSGSVWDSPIYGDLIQAVRSVNAGLQLDRRLRVVAADYPIDFNALPGHAINRDRAAAEVIQHEVLDKNRRALVIFGTRHLFRDDPERFVYMLKNDSRARWFIVGPISGPGYPASITVHKASRDKPVLFLTNGSLGNVDASDLGWEEPHTATLRQMVEAVLYFGENKPVIVPSVSGR